MRMRSSFRSVICAATLGVFAASGTFAQAVSNLDQQAWEAVNNKLIAKIQGVDSTLLKNFAIQLTSTPVYVMWDQGDNGAWEFLNVADQVPNWGPTWFPSGNRFSDEYLKFASSVAIRTRDDVNAKDVDAKDTAYKTLSEQTSKALRALLAERVGYKKKQLAAGEAVMPYTQWVTDLSKNGPTWKSLQAKQAAAYTAWSNLLSPEERSLGLLKKKMTEFSPDPDKDTVKGETRYPYNYAAASVAQIKTDGDAAWTAKTPVFTFNSTSDTQHRSEERESWGGHASYGFFVSVGANHEHYSLDISNQASSFTYAAYGLGFIGIEPRGWYSGALVTQYKDKKRAFLPQSPVSFETLWGPTGSLNLQPVGVIVAYRPQITAHMTSEQIKKVKDTLTAGGSVSWGPFSFGGSYTKTSETVDSHAEQGLITISSTSPYPYLVAVLSRRLNYVAP